jgi:ribosomal protein S27AE
LVGITFVGKGVGLMNEMKCPLCGGKMFMYEHYDYYNDNELQQEQNYECGNCHNYTAQLIVNYVETSREWNREEIG